MTSLRHKFKPGINMYQDRIRQCLLYGIASVLALLGAVTLVSMEPLSGFHDNLGVLPPSVLGGVLLLGAGLLLLPATRRRAALFLAAYWSGTAIAGAAMLGENAKALANWIPISEAVIFASVVGLYADRRALPLLGVTFGLGLILFGVVHLTYRDAIAGMIPSWIPSRELAPWATGFVNLACGLLIVTGFHKRLAAALIALVFVSWLPIVHAPRLMNAMDSAYEWTFALTAVALILSAIAIAQSVDLTTGAIEPREGQKSVASR